MWKTIGASMSSYRSYPRIVGETGGKDFIIAHPSADPDALAVRLGSDGPPLIVDLRHQLDLESRPTSLPGAIVVGVDELTQWAEGIPRDREIILTCD